MSLQKCAENLLLPSFKGVTQVHYLTNVIYKLPLLSRMFTLIHDNHTRNSLGGGCYFNIQEELISPLVTTRRTNLPCWISFVLMRKTVIQVWILYAQSIELVNKVLVQALWIWMFKWQISCLLINSKSLVRFVRVIYKVWGKACAIFFLCCIISQRVHIGMLQWSC